MIRPDLDPGLALYRAGRYFEAHELLEELWAPAGEPDRSFLQALIHVAVAYHHLERGNLTGARRQLAKARAKLRRYEPCWAGIDTAALGSALDHRLTAIERGDAPPAAPPIEPRD